MRYDVRYIDVNPNVASGQQPIYMLQRELVHGDDPRGGVFSQAKVGRRGEYWVPVTRLFDAGPVQFAATKQSEFVRVPLWDYPINKRALSTSIAFGIQLGVELLSQAIEEVRTRTNHPVTKAVIVIGHECHDITQSNGEPGLRCYVGLALAVDG